MTDGRGIPYALQPLTLQPAALEPLVTDHQGKFDVHIGQPGDYLLAQAATLTMDQDRTYTYYRLPTDNILAHGGFEQPLANGPWQISGTVALTQSAELVHSGSQTLQLGRRCPAPCLATLPGSGVASRWHQALLMDAHGNLHHWTVVTPNTLIHQIRMPDGRWLPYVALDNGITNWTPAMGFAQNGDLHLVWSSRTMGGGGPDESLYYAVYRNGQGWSTPEFIGPGTNPKIAIDAQQQVHLIYRCSDFTNCPSVRLAYRKRDSVGAWSAQQLLKTTDILTQYALATTGNTVHLIWGERSNLRSMEYLFTAIFTAGRISQQAQLDAVVTPTTGLGHYSRLQFLVDRQQALHLGWTLSNEDTFYYAHRPFGAAWSSVEQLRYAADTYSFGEPAMLLDNQETLHVIIPRYAAVPSLYWRRDRAGQWLTVAPISIFTANNQQLTAVALGLHDELYFALEDSEPTALLKTTATLTATQISQIAQQLTIPATFHQPTLAFLYQLTGSGSAASPLTVAVSAGVTTTTLFSSTTAGAWQLGWADLTPWQGETVTVTFTLTQAAGDRYRQVLLDDVSLGSWFTPLPQAVTPNRLAWGVAESLTITGSNFIATPAVYLGDRLLSNPTWVDAQTLHVSVPPDLNPGRHDLWVVNPSGERMLLASSVAIGRQSYLPLLYR